MLRCVINMVRISMPIRCAQNTASRDTVVPSECWLQRGSENNNTNTDTNTKNKNKNNVSNKKNKNTNNTNNNTNNDDEDNGQ